MSQQNVPSLRKLRGPGARGRVVQRQHEIRGTRRVEPTLDDLPRLEPVGQREHAVVVPEWCAHPRRGGLRGGHARHDPHPHCGAVPGRDLLQHRRSHREHPGVPGRDDGDPGAGGRQPQCFDRAVRLDAVARGMPLLPRLLRDTRDIRAIADDVLSRRQLGFGFRCQPFRPRRAQPDHDDLAAFARGRGRRGAAVDAGPVRRARQQRQREVRHRRRIDVRERLDPLRPPRRAFDVPGVVQLPGLRERVTHRAEGAPELQHGRGIGVGEAARQLRRGERAGQHRQHLVTLHQRAAEHR